MHSPPVTLQPVLPATSPRQTLSITRLLSSHFSKVMFTPPVLSLCWPLHSTWHDAGTQRQSYCTEFLRSHMAFARGCKILIDHYSVTSAFLRWNIFHKQDFLQCISPSKFRNQQTIFSAYQPNVCPTSTPALQRC